MYVLYSPKNLTKLFQYVALLVLVGFIVFCIIGLFYLIISNTTAGLKYVFSYILFSFTILSLIALSIGKRTVFRPSYTISIDDTNLITYQTSKNVVNQFTFSDIASITEEGPFCFNLKDKSAFYLPYKMENDNVFFEKLFNNYKTEISNEELFRPLKRKNRIIAITFVILVLPYMLIPFLLGNVFVIFLFLISLTSVFLHIDNTELKKINPDTIEVRKNFKNSVITKSDVSQIIFFKRFIHIPRGGGGYVYGCELITKSNKIYRFKTSSLSSIELYCYLTFWTNTTHQRCLTI